MKTRTKQLIIAFALVSLTSSCFLSRDPHGRRTDRGRRYPHDKPQQQQGQQ
ncbi:hypothetical protein KHS38_06975 [Mucilaginibacter sp. Bleaf8]|uniref:hypothetical protein n=1 Tax=Mucilaginibacter sp. Bleaf8 TaxID=2834430 RepID=UPI001BCDB0CB|nr:hypothetical protein [Mucilaginibacter sp. Bleaf8]MBS7564143.1 hypothetical protein [Mucilaginibacter sp. Bleaf8]